MKYRFIAIKFIAIDIFGIQKRGSLPGDGNTVGSQQAVAAALFLPLAQRPNNVLPHQGTRVLTMPLQKRPHIGPRS